MRKKKSGFTLVEIAIVVAIVGIIAVVAVPGYVRVRMNTNMALVQQQMRVIGEKMMEILGRKGVFPDPNDWWQAMKSSADPDEVSITGNLSAIAYACYSTTDFFTNEARTSYRFYSWPDKTKPCWRFAGNKGFLVHADSELSAGSSPGVVTEIEFDSLSENNPWPGNFSNSNFAERRPYQAWSDSASSFREEYESDPVKLLKWMELMPVWLYYWPLNFEIIATKEDDKPDKLLEAYKREMQWRINALTGGSGKGIYSEDGSRLGLSGVVPIGLMNMQISNYDLFAKTLEQVYPQLREKGIDVVIRKANTENAAYIAEYERLEGITRTDPKTRYEISFKFTNSSEIYYSDLEDKMEKFCEGASTTVISPWTCM